LGKKPLKLLPALEGDLFPRGCEGGREEKRRGEEGKGGDEM